MSNVLATICQKKKEHIEKQKQSISENKLLEQISLLPAPKPFFESLKKRAFSKQTALITEVKKASPSKGVIREHFDPVAIAKAYEKAGATCISVLTDIPYFQGNDSYLQAIRSQVALPLLRKDFMLDTYQILESRMLGADCILLIMAALEDSQAKELEAAALSLGMDVLIEVHNTKELERALTLKSSLIGINNRNLKTLTVDLATSEELIGTIPDSYVTVCESGIRDINDIKRMHKAGIYCFLIGESLMQQQDIEAATKALLK